MLLNQLVQEHHAVRADGAAVNDNAANDSVANENVEPTSGVVLKANVDSNGASSNQSKCGEDAPQSRADLRTQAMHRFLSSQTDVSEEVLLLYKLVCTGFR